MTIGSTMTNPLDRLVTGLLTGSRLPLPRCVSIEPVGNLCQLKCPLCPVGVDALDDPPRLMSLETFKNLLAKLPFVRVVDLYRSGEPFLNPELFAMIDHARQRKAKVIVSSHLSFTKDAGFFEALVRSGLERLVVSLDGVSQESYSRYRVGGDYELVVANVRRVIEAKKRLNSKKPEIVWQYLINKYNEPEIPAARALAAELGVILDLRTLDLDDELPDMEPPEPLEERKARWLPSHEHRAERYQGEFSYPLFPGICQDLFSRPVITVDGKVMPCCLLWNTQNAFGDLTTQSFEEVWFSRRYFEARCRFLVPGFAPRETSACFSCRNFGASPSTKDKLKLLLAVYRKNLREWLKGLT